MSVLHNVSPMLESLEMQQICGQPVLLKLENTQPSGSFKIRGIGNLLQKEVRNNSKH